MVSPTHRPGQRRRLWAVDLETHAYQTMGSIGPIVLELQLKNSPQLGRLEVNPIDWGQSSGVVRDVAELWQGANSQGHHTTARAHLRVLTSAFKVFVQHGVRRWSDLTIETLTAIEGNHANDQEIGFFWNCLRRIPEDSMNGRMAEDVVRFIQSAPNIRRKQTVPTEALKPELLRDVIRAAMADISQAEYRIKKADWDGCSVPSKNSLIRRHEMVAFYVLLCVEWGMSPDVIKDLSFDSAQPTSVQDWNDGGPKIDVRWYKRRGGSGANIVMLADQPWRAGSLMRRLRDAAAATRFAAPASWVDFPWLCSTPLAKRAARHPRQFGSAEGDTYVVQSIFKGGDQGFLKWCQHSRRGGLAITIPDRYTRAVDPDWLTYRAIRPAAKWARYTATGKGLLLSELVDDNTIETLSAHYLNSEVAMRDIGESWQHITTIAEEVARGSRPTVVNRQGDVVSGRGITPPELAQSQVNRVGTSGCRNPYDSPLSGESPGRLCGSANRACFFCPNSVVTPSDLPSLKAYLLLADQAKCALPPSEWALHWGRTVRWIQYVLPLLDPEWEAIPVGDVEIFDLGLQAGPA